MNHVQQLLFWLTLTGVVMVAGLPLLSDYNIVVQTAVCILWVLFMLSTMDALWALGSTKGRDWVDRGGLFIRGLGFIGLAAFLLLLPGLLSYMFGVTGIFLIVLGRAVWELVVDRPKRDK